LRKAYAIVYVTASLFDTEDTVVRKKVALTDPLLRGGWLGADSSDFVKYFPTAFSMVRLEPGTNSFGISDFLYFFVHRRGFWGLAIVLPCLMA
jgi:hypothetical protein